MTVAPVATRSLRELEAARVFFADQENDLEATVSVFP